MVFPDPDDKSKFQKDTLFDGEIVNDIEEDKSITTRLYVFDCLLDRTKNLMSRPLQKRLGYFESHVLKPHIEWKRRVNPKDLPFDLVCKPMVKAYHFDETYKKLSTLKHNSDGLIFTAISAPYKIGTCEAMLKWKPPSENSIDFKLILFYQNGKPEYPDKRPDRFELHENRGKKGYHYYDELYVEDEWEEWREKEIIVDDKTSEKRLNLNGRIVEVFRDESRKWRFLRFRDDKTDGNYFTVVRNIIQSIEDGVSLEESLAPVRIFQDEATEERAENARLSSFIGAIAVGDL
ncbi:12934_t:CDS:2, partial [Acaulospora morrowiae]